MKRILKILSCMLISCSFAFSQLIKPSHEIGLFGGTAYYIGDLNDLHFRNPTKEAYGSNLDKIAYGLVYRRNFGDRISFKASGLYGKVSAYDRLSDSDFKQYRNQSFRTSMIELSGQIEFNFYRVDPNSYTHYFSPYVFIGGGYLKMNPEGDYNDLWYALQPLNTEGQGLDAYPDRSPYKLNQFTIPMGVGFKIYPAENFGISIEWGMRKMYTDYLDDISTTYANPNLMSPTSVYFADKTPIDDELKSFNTNRQRGDSKTKDWYNFTGITLTYRINKKRIVCP